MSDTFLETHQELGFFWNDWPKDMQATTLPPPQGMFSFRGTCPHCLKPSVLAICMATSNNPQPVHREADGKTWAIMQCQACLKFILGCALYENNSRWRYMEHLPLGKPNDDIAPEIPAHIGADFREARRCRFVDAFNATVEMCRRAVQASCIDLKAPSDKKLVAQIDWLASNGVITTPLKDMAHRVRLGGNLGAHPPEDPNDPDEIVICPEYADAVLEFTEEFFQHIYVMPERLKKFTFKKTP